MMKFPKNEELFDPGHTRAAGFLSSFAYPWESLPHLKAFILSLGQELGDDFYSPAEGVFISRTAKVAESALILAPCIIGAGSEVRHCAFIRGSVIVGEGCVVGNSTELKNCILSDSVQAPHYNYIGDSVLGYRAHLGAGAIISNLKADKTEVLIAFDGGKIATGLRKLGAMVGDRVEIGCNAVLNPGSIIGRDTTVYPLSPVRGVIPSGVIVRQNGAITVKEKGRN